METEIPLSWCEWREMVRSDRKKRKGRRVGGETGRCGGREDVRGDRQRLGVPPTIESMREPRKSRSEAPEMGGIGDTLPWNRGNPHSHTRPRTAARFTGLYPEPRRWNLKTPPLQHLYELWGPYTPGKRQSDTKRANFFVHTKRNANVCIKFD